MLDIWRLQHKKRRIIAKADKEHKRHQAAEDLKGMLDVASACYQDCKHIDEHVDRLLYDSIYEKAQKLDIAMPPVSEIEMWKRDENEVAYLSAQGRFNVRKLIDQEKARRFEVKTLWVTKIILPLAGVFVGIIGALTGLVAVMQHKK